MAYDYKFISSYQIIQQKFFLSDWISKGHLPCVPRVVDSHPGLSMVYTRCYGYTQDVKRMSRYAMVIQEMLNERAEMI